MENSGGGIVFPLIIMVAMIVVIAGVWKTFSKAGKPGWACLIPRRNSSPPGRR